MLNKYIQKDVKDVKDAKDAKDVKDKGYKTVLYINLVLCEEYM